ncbi:MAG: DUF1566 domain-containing protein [Gammaproteobacteria bacterium]|nr:DUF1566 domain-containing protein [Gammaproteobacteria bacterium]
MKNFILFTVALLSPVTYAAQECKNNIAPSTPDNRFTLNNDGTVLDKQTGLLWMQCRLGQNWANNDCSDDIVEYNWIDALAAAEDTNFAGFSDWRLPNIKELASIVELSCKNPSINEFIFPNSISIDSWQTRATEYWTSTPYAIKGNNQYSYYIDFGLGEDSEWRRSSEYLVRLVRTAQ